MPNAVLIIDMVRGFLEPGHNLYCGDESRLVIPKLRELAERELSRGSKLLFLCDNHAPDDLEFRIFPPHCIRWTAETEVIEELRDLPGDIIPKTRYSAFHNTTLDDHLMHIGPDRLIITGVCTDICVLYTAADARNRDFDVEVPVDCVRSFDRDQHGFAIEHMKRILGIQVMTADERG
jgi:nicotinamidase/pyrazinamidase